MPQEKDYPAWIEEQQRYFTKRQDSIYKDHKLAEDIEYESKAKEIDENLNYRKKVGPSLDYTPDRGTTKTEKVYRNPTAMEKVDAELDKQDYKFFLENKTQYNTTKKLLQEKEDRHSVYQTKEERDLFEEALELQKDRDAIHKYESERDFREGMQKSINEDKEGSHTKTDFNKEVLEGEYEAYLKIRDENRSATIHHKGHEWEYEKKGDQERFQIKNEQGTPLITIEKLDKDKDFDARRNAYILGDTNEKGEKNSR